MITSIIALTLTLLLVGYLAYSFVTNGKDRERASRRGLDLRLSKPYIGAAVRPYVEGLSTRQVHQMPYNTDSYANHAIRGYGIGGTYSFVMFLKNLAAAIRGYGIGGTYSTEIKVDNKEKAIRGYGIGGTYSVAIEDLTREAGK